MSYLREIKREKVRDDMNTQKNTQTTVDITMKLFNAVPKHGDDYCYSKGVFMMPGAQWAETKIRSYITRNVLSAEQLNMTFHKSWQTVQESTDEYLLLTQILHYLSTYGTNFAGDTFIPAEDAEIPVDMRVFIVRAYTNEELIQKCLGILERGVALKQETLLELFDLLDELGYAFDGSETVNNKEAQVLLADRYNVFPDNEIDFLRYLVYKSTDQTLLIKNRYMIETISQSSFNPGPQMKKFGLKKLAKIFNRFKPIFLAWKGRCPRTINRISKLSKTCHQPLPENPLNQVTAKRLEKVPENATIYAVFRALNACYARLHGQDNFLYRIRNGKSWATTESNINISVCEQNYWFLMDYLKETYGENIRDQHFIMPDNVDYALPTSEKMFVGNVPMGTKIRANKHGIAAGVYWRNEWGANDIDVSAIDARGNKFGWDADYRSNSNKVTYSGDITNAPDGAVEYILSKGHGDPLLILSNVYSGNTNCGYKIVVGQGDKVSRKYMMNPNKVMIDEKTESVSKQTIIGMIMPDNSFVVMNTALGNLPVSVNNENVEVARNALIQQWSNSLTLRDVITRLGGVFVETGPATDLSIRNISKDTIMSLFEKQ